MPSKYPLSSAIASSGGRIKPEWQPHLQEGLLHSLCSPNLHSSDSSKIQITDIFQEKDK